MNQKVLLFVITLAAFVVVFLLLSRLLSDKSSRYQKKSLENITRGDFSDENSESYLLAAKREEVFAEKIVGVPFFGNIYRKLQQAGDVTSFSAHLFYLLLVGIVVSFLAFYFLKSPLYAVCIGLVAILYYNGTRLNRKLEKRNDYFLNHFPDAIDMMVRSVKSGHPLISSMRLIAQNAEPPISTEFQRVINEVSYGRPMPEALRKMADRIGLMDVNFFVVILSVQQETGGNLAEVLTNLSTIIRKRKQLKLKINALTAEGRITAKIFAAIPLLQMTFVRFSSKEYLDPLFETTAGNICLTVALIMIVASIYITKKLTDLDI